MKIGNRHILFMAAARGNYGVINRPFGNNEGKSPHHGNRAGRLVKKGLASKLRHLGRREVAAALQEAGQQSRDNNHYMDKEGTIGNILDVLEDNKKAYGLEGVEITREDAEEAARLIAGGISREEAVETVLSGIRQCLDDGMED